jgi:hypothetical protein
MGTAHVIRKVRKLKPHWWGSMLVERSTNKRKNCDKIGNNNNNNNNNSSNNNVSPVWWHIEVWNVLVSVTLEIIRGITDCNHTVICAARISNLFEQFSPSRNTQLSWSTLTFIDVTVKITICPRLSRFNLIHLPHNISSPTNYFPAFYFACVVKNV